MRNRIFFGLIALGLVAAGIIFQNCNKDKVANGKAETINSQVGNLVNPFEQYGIWHNECLEYMFSQPNAFSLPYDTLWQKFGAPFFQQVFGGNYKPISLNDLHAAYQKTYNIVENKQYLKVLKEMVDVGMINPNYTSPYIGRNNYQILLDYFTFLTNHKVKTKADYLIAHNKLCEIEQEILANYYELVSNGITVYPEYDGVLSCMSVFRNSSEFWKDSHYSSVDDWYYNKKVACMDAMAYNQQIVFDYWESEMTGQPLNDRNSVIYSGYISGGVLK